MSTTVSDNALGKYTAREVAAILEVFQYDNDYYLGWTVGEDRNLETFWVLCNDLFAWGSADEEVIEPDDIPALRQAHDDAEGDFYWPELWVARKRHMRPQGAVLNEIKGHRKVIELFLDAGPERPAALMNPEAWKGWEAWEAEEKRRLEGTPLD